MFYYFILESCKKPTTSSNCFTPSVSNCFASLIKSAIKSLSLVITSFFDVALFTMTL